MSLVHSSDTVALRATRSATNRRTVYYGLNYQDGVSNTQLRPGFEKLWSGVLGGRIITDSPIDALVEVEEGEVLTIFYPDGNVAKLNCDNLTGLADKKPQLLAAHDALGERLDHIFNLMPHESEQMDDVARRKTEDRWLHELASMLKTAKNHREARSKILAAVEYHMKGKQLRSAVRAHFVTVLKEQNDATIYSWLVGDEIAEKPSEGLNLRMLNGLIRGQHDLIERAIAGALPWEFVGESFRRSAERGELGHSAQKRFCNNCPPLTGLSEKVGKLPVAFVEGEKKASPLGNKTKPKGDRAKLEAARNNRRLERNKDRPKGMQGSKENPGDAARKRREAKQGKK